MNLKKLLLIPLLLFTCIILASCDRSNFIYYTVTFDSTGGTSVESAEVISGNPIRKPNDPTYDGFTFNGWYKDPETVQANIWDFGTDRVTSDITLYAGWTPDQSVEATESLTFALEGNEYVVTGVGEDTRVIIPATHQGLPVVAIGEAAFARKDVVQVILPDSIEEIRLNAFNNCSSLETIYIGENSVLASIANNAFSGNASLTSINIPATMTSLGDSAFNNCGSLERFVVSSTNPTYASLNGHLVEKATNILIRGANNPDIPEGVLEIAQAAFRRSHLTEINIPASVTTIGNYAFNDIESLTAINVDSNNQIYSSVDGVLYNKAQTEFIEAPEAIDGTVNLPATLVELPLNAFDGRTELDTIIIPVGDLERIRHFAFRNTTVDIKYVGTEEQWNEITKASLWGGASLNIEFNYQEAVATSNVLVVYFTRTNTTEGVAQYIQQATSADIVEIVPETAYVSDYTALLTVARNELAANARPAISEETLSQINIDDYSTIFIGYPIWHGSEPMIIRSFIEAFDNLAGKTVYPFSTSASSGGTTAYNSIRSLCSDATVTSYLHLNSSGVREAETRVNQWIGEIMPLTVEGRRVKMTLPNQEIYFTLVDNSATRDLVARLSEADLTLTFTDYGSNEKIAYPTPRLDVSDTEGHAPKAGDVTIYVPWGNIAIFYVDWPQSDDLVHLGTLDDNQVSLLSSQQGEVVITLSLV